MTEERKKRFYPKRGQIVACRERIAFAPVKRGRTPIDDSKWTDEAIKGMSEGIYKSASEAALTIAVREGGNDIKIERNRKRIAVKINDIIRSRKT